MYLSAVKCRLTDWMISEKRRNYRKKNIVYCTNTMMVKIKIKHEDILCIVMFILRIILKKEVGVRS